jgi:ferredoxin
MPKRREKRKSKAESAVDIFEILTESSEKAKKKRRAELLAPLSVKEFFVEGNISIDKRTCKGVECKLCIKACPTNALFWRAGEVGIVEDLCVFCGACVLSCIVDDCIKVERKRADGVVERFSKPRDFTALQHGISVKKRCGGILDMYRHPKKYLKSGK